MKKLDARIWRSKRSGKLVLGAVLMVSLCLGVVLAQGLVLALDAGRDDLVVRAVLGLGLLVGLCIFSVVAIRRQYRLLDEAREDLEELAGPARRP